MAIKYYASDFDRREDQYFNNSPDIGITKKDVKQWIEYNNAEFEAEKIIVEHFGRWEENETSP